MEKAKAITESAKDHFSDYDPESEEKFYRRCEETRTAIMKQPDLYLSEFSDQVVIAAFPLVQLTEKGEEHFKSEPEYDVLPSWREVSKPKYFDVETSIGIPLIAQLRSIDEEMTIRIILAIGIIRGTLERDIVLNHKLLRKGENHE